MDQTLIPAGWEQILQVMIFLFVVVGFFRQFATQRDIKDLSDRLGKLEAGQTELKASQAALETRFSIQEDRLSLVEKKADAALDLHKTVHIDIKVLQASVNRLESYFETPKLKSS